MTTHKEALEAAYLAGFNASGEGYNGEYPFGDKMQDPAENRVWKKDRDNYIKEVLAQPEQEPVAWIRFDSSGRCRGLLSSDSNDLTESRKAIWQPLYTTPPQCKPFNHHEFGYWWFEYGSGLHPLEGEDQEQHAYRVATAAWQAAHGIKE